MFRRTGRVVAITVLTAAAAALPAASASAYEATLSDIVVSSATVAPAPPATHSVVDPDATDVAGKPKIKIEMTLRVRPTGARVLTKVRRDIQPTRPSRRRT